MSEDLVTFYEVIGISQNASAADIKAAYRRQAMKLHPDRGGSAHAMNLLNKAYRVLGHAESRAKYDEHLRRQSQRQSAEERQAETTRSASEPTAEELLSQERIAVAKVKSAAWKEVWKGIGIFIVGVIITAIGYNAASGSGSTYFVFWGLMLWGIIAALKGWYHVLNPYRALHKVLDTP